MSEQTTGLRHAFRKTPAWVLVISALLAFLPVPASAQMFNYSNRERPSAKIDVDADFNGDGVIDNNDPSDNGPVQVTPPGLLVPVGELAPAVIRYRVRRPDLHNDTVVHLEIRGINREVKSGKFKSIHEETASAGRLKIWRDAHRTKLLLDSGNPELRKISFTRDDGPVPQKVFLEGVSPSRHPGSLQFIAWVSSRSKVVKFVNSRDYILVTVSK